MQEGIETVYFNLFLDTVTDPALKELEAFLHIDSSNKTLEERRRAVKPYFSGFGKVSAALIESIISSYTNASVTSELKICDEKRNQGYFIEMMRGTGQLNLKEIQTFVRRKLPAHLALFLKVVLKLDAGAKLQVRSYTRIGTKLKIKAKG